MRSPSSLGTRCKPRDLIRLAGGEDFRLFLLWLFDFFFLAVVAFAHDELLGWMVALRVTLLRESAMGKWKAGFAQRTAEG